MYSIDLARFNKKDIISKINQQIVLGNRVITFLKENHSIDDMREKYDDWVRKTESSLKEIFIKNKIAQNFRFKVMINTNIFSKKETSKILLDASIDGITYLETLKEEISKNSSIDNNSLDTESALILIKRLLQNFYKHIQIMYQEKVHASGTIKKEDLDRIKIGNEYDVQRILYSIIKPIFPESRVEVFADTGYKSVRYDIVIDEFDIVIEIKCTRKNMTERSLSEELGSDAFHYKATHLLLFVYDKQCIIKNVDSFIKSFLRTKDEFGIYTEAIVNQPINL